MMCMKITRQRVCIFFGSSLLFSFDAPIVLINIMNH